MDPIPPNTEDLTTPDLKEITEQKVINLSKKIAVQARIFNSKEPKDLNWSEWSTGGLEPQTPITLGDLKAEFPDLVRVLETPSGDVEVRRDSISDETTLSTLSFWRNPDGHGSSIQLTLNNKADLPKTIRRVSLEAGNSPSRTWENIGLMRNSKSYTGSDDEVFLNALDQASLLADKIIGSGSFNAYYSDRSEDVGLANWERPS